MAKEELTKWQATYRFIISLIWLAVILNKFCPAIVAPQNGLHHAHVVPPMEDFLVVFLFFGFLGLFQCLFQGKEFIKFAAGIMLGSLISGPNIYEVYKDSTGKEYRKPADGGCVGSLIAGSVIVLALAFIASPVVFNYNFYNFIIVWTRNTRLAKFFRYVTILFLCTFNVASLYGFMWLFRQS